MSNTVMIVDDAAFMRATLKDVITKGGYQVVAEAVNGKDALEKYKVHKPDVVTMDITMPEMDGLEALRQLMGINPGAKVIMCSAIGQQANVVEAIKNGAKDFIVKPFQPDRVLEALKKVLG
ncbi:MAG: response regulator [bacterium]|nr:response regulator [bacterium]